MVKSGMIQPCYCGGCAVGAQYRRERSLPLPFVPESPDAVPLTLVAASERAGMAGLDGAALRWLEATGFKAEPGQVALVPARDGGLARVVVGWKPGQPLWALAALPETLPERDYRLDGAPPGDATALALGWALGAYAFIRYKRRDKGWARLAWPAGADRGEVEGLADAIFLARDLINTPAEDMGPFQLGDAVETLAGRHRARCRIIVGDALLAENYPTIHAVGRAASAARAPRLIDLTWGDAAAPKVTLVGKGVCFDTGGLDLKPAGAMLAMKKDMGGAATLLGLASAIMAAGLPVRLAADPGGRKLGLGRGDPPARHRQDAQGPDRRDRQYRCRGPAHPVRRAGRGRYREARAPGRFRDPDRGGADRARPRTPRPLRQ
jgi:leucyl aminopeptidase